jgi:hypothetical protein
MSDAIVLDVADTTPARLDVGDADPIARQEIAELAGRVTTVEGDVTALDSRMDTAEGDISTLGTAVDGIDARVEAIEADGSVTTAKLANGSVTPAKLADTPLPSLLAGAALSLTGDEPTEATFLDRACPGTTGQATVQSVRGNTVVQDGSLLPVRMEGIETTGFNQWDEVAEDGYISDTTGENVGSNVAYLRSKDYIPVLPGMAYHFTLTTGTTGGKVYYYDADKAYLSFDGVTFNGADKTTPANARYMRFWLNYPGSYNHDICINISDPSRNGTYEPHWSSERAILASTYFPDGMRGVGDSRDELTNHEAIHRMGSVTLNGSETWAKSASYPGGYYINNWVVDNSIAYATNHVQNRFATATAISEYKEWTCYFENALNLRVPETVAPTVRDFVAWLAENPVTIHYPLATPTTTPIDPPLNLTYRAENGGTERITHTEQSAPPVLSIAYGHTAEGIVREAASAIAAQDGPTATTNHAMGSYLTMGGTLYRVTTAIATGEAITPGTNVMATTVMAEVLSLIQ